MSLKDFMLSEHERPEARRILARMAIVRFMSFLVLLAIAIVIGVFTDWHSWAKAPIATAFFAASLFRLMSARSALEYRRNI